MTQLNILLNYTLVNGNSLHPKLHYRWRLIGDNQLKQTNKEENNKFGVINLKKLTSSKEQDEYYCKPKGDKPNLLMIITHILNEDVFIDPYQLATQLNFYKDLYHQQSLLPYLFKDTPIELELPIYEVNSSYKNTFQLVWNLNGLPLNDLNNEMQFILPMHLRYRKPSLDTNYERVYINAPVANLICLNDIKYKADLYERLIEQIHQSKSLPFNLMLSDDYPDLNENDIKIININSTIPYLPSTSPKDNQIIQSTKYKVLTNLKYQSSLLPKLSLNVPTGQLQYQTSITLITTFALLFCIFYLFRILKKYAPKPKLLSPPSSPTTDSFLIIKKNNKNKI